MELVVNVLGRGVTVAGSASVRFLLGCGVALLEEVDARMADLSELKDCLGLEADWRWAGRMRLDETEFVMFVMLLRGGSTWAALGLGVARLGSFSPSGVACLEAAFAMAVVQSRGCGCVRGGERAARCNGREACELAESADQNTVVWVTSTMNSRVKVRWW